MSGRVAAAGSTAPPPAFVPARAGTGSLRIRFGRVHAEVPPGTVTESPFELVTLPGGPVAALVVAGPWGRDSQARWSRLFSWLSARGYIVVGPPTEAWSGDAAHPEAQVTEMRVPVVATRR